MRGKLILFEGTDYSGKTTQFNKLKERLTKENIKIFDYHYPQYDDPTGKIVGGPYLGKKTICEGYFSEGAANVDPKVATLYYAADFKYSAPKIESYLETGTTVLLDRYCFSSFGHQGGKIEDKNERIQMYKWLDKLFFEQMELRKPDLLILLYMPYEYSVLLKEGRVNEVPDQHESSKKHLVDAQKAYLEVADLYNFKVIECIKDGKIRTIEDIHEEIYRIVKEII